MCEIVIKSQIGVNTNPSLHGVPGIGVYFNNVGGKVFHVVYTRHHAAAAWRAQAAKGGPQTTKWMA